MPKVKKPVVVESSSSESESDLQTETDVETEIESESEPETKPEPEVTKTKTSKKSSLDVADVKLKTVKKSKDWVDMDIETPKHKQVIAVSAGTDHVAKRDDSKTASFDGKASSFDYTKFRDLDLSIEDMVKYCVVKSHDQKQFQLGKIFKQILKGINFEDVLPEVKPSGMRGSFEVRGRGGYRGGEQTGSYRGREQTGGYRGRGGEQTGGYRGRGNPRTFQYDE